MPVAKPLSELDVVGSVCIPAYGNTREISQAHVIDCAARSAFRLQRLRAAVINLRQGLDVALAAIVNNPNCDEPITRNAYQLACSLRDSAVRYLLEGGCEV